MAFRLTFGRIYYRTARRIPPDVLPAVRATFDALESAVDLPGPEDLADVIPPSLRVWRRRARASAWWVYFTVECDGVDIVAVAVPMY